MLSLAAATTLDAGARATIDAAQAAGFDACGLRPTVAELAGRVVADLAWQLDSSGLTVLDVEVIRLGVQPPAVEPERLLDFGARLGARYALAVSHQDDPGRGAADLAALAEAAADRGLRVALEFMRFTAVPTLASALDLVERAGRDDIGVLVDALHLQRSGGTPADLARIPPGGLAYVQLCDAAAAGPAEPAELADEARHRRLLPGSGALPLRELVARAGRGVPFSVEVQSDELAASVAPGPRARLALSSAREFLTDSASAWSARFT